MLPTAAFFTILAISQSLVWVDFIVKSVKYIMPADAVPPLTALIVALTTSAVALFASCILLVCKRGLYLRKPESMVLHAIPARK